MELHQDNRRILESFPEAKIITAKESCVIGKHYHKVKTEKFILTSGKCKLIVSNVEGIPMAGKFNMKKGHLYTLPPNTYHEFHIEEGSVLVGINSHPYDQSDDYKIE